MNDNVNHEAGMRQGVCCALLAAALFGASTPLAKALADQMVPVALAGVLYLGSGAGLLLFYLLRALARRASQGATARIPARDLPWLAAAIAAGGVAGPVLLMFGLTLTPASSASLLLNIEGVLTSMLAWFVFRENFDRRIFIGMLLIVAAGMLLSWEQMPAVGVPWGAFAIVGACLCWGIDNNLTRKVSASDAVQIAMLKGLVAGCVNLAIAWALGARWPPMTTLFMTGLVGLGGYGLSFVMFVLALRHLGTARTGAYFSAAPFVGAALSLLMFGEQPGWPFWLATALMGGGIWLHLSESHGHEHAHEPLAHAHGHVHDTHHQHEHEHEGGFAPDGAAPHVHVHEHRPMRHGHAHCPDIHHRHGHT